MNKSAWMLALAASLVVPTQVQAENRGCAQPKTGRYVVMERGLVGTEPTARLIQERWLPNGQIKGLFFERTGQDSRRERYSGTYQALSSCQVRVKRQLSSTTESTITVLNPNSEPAYGLGTQPQTVISNRWFLQGPETCQATDLNGVVLSRQRGLSWDGASWQPNAVVQREVWDNGTVRGDAISSYNGRQEQASYTGEIKAREGCWARLIETDSKGVEYNCDAVLLTGGRGYIYLQQEASDLTIGLLERVSP